MAVVETQEKKMPAHHLIGSQLSISAGGKPLLQGLDFHVSTGEIVGIWGASGCGKSTLLRAITGLIPLDEGSVELDTQIPDAIGFPNFRQQVRYVAQRPAFNSDSVDLHFQRACTYQSASTPYSSLRESIQSQMKQIHLAPVQLHDQANTLSEGEQQRVHLIRSILSEPAFLLLDEPTSALDPESLGAVEKLVIQGAEQDQWGALWVSHDRVQLERVCTHVIELAHYRMENTHG